MKFLIIFFLNFVLGDDGKCDMVTECSAGLENRLAALENAISKFSDENKNLKEENAGLRRELDVLRKDMDDVEAVVLPWKVRASCQEHADRGENQDGIYSIRPSLDVNAFDVKCKFRKSGRMPVKLK